ncbi:hypothetical protein KUCAC02_036506, partial [Chaenocephalus aceratus]
EVRQEGVRTGGETVSLTHGMRQEVRQEVRQFSLTQGVRQEGRTGGEPVSLTQGVRQEGVRTGGGETGGEDSFSNPRGETGGETVSLTQEVRQEGDETGGETVSLTQRVRQEGVRQFSNPEGETVSLTQEVRQEKVETVSLTREGVRQEVGQFHLSHHLSHHLSPPLSPPVSPSLTTCLPPLSPPVSPPLSPPVSPPVSPLSHHLSPPSLTTCLPPLSPPVSPCWGLWQISMAHVTLISLPGLMMASQNLLNNFVSGSPAHHCSLPTNQSSRYNLSHYQVDDKQLLRAFIPMDSSGSRLDRCRRFVEPQWQLLAANSSANVSQIPTEGCLDGWAYDRSEFLSTTVSE